MISDGAVRQRYLATLAAELPVSRRAKAQIIAELDDGLQCAMQERLQRGELPADAARATVAEFGDPRQLARAYAAQLAPAAAHRIGLTLVVTGPVVGLVWAATYGAGASTWPARIGAVLTAMPFLPVVLAVTIPAAILAATGSGLPARICALPARWATNAAAIAATGCVVADIALIAATAPSRAASAGLLPFAIAFSAVRSCLSALGMRRLLRLRAAAS